MALLLFVLLGGGAYSLWQLARANYWVRHTDSVRLSIARLLSTMLDAETGVRGYVVTGEPAFLEPYDSAASRWGDEFGHLRALTADNPLQQARLAKIQQAAGERFTMISKLRADYDAGLRGEALVSTMREGKLAMDSVRSLIGELQQEEVQLDGIRQHAATQRWRLTLLIFALGGLAFATAMAGSWRLRLAAERHRRDSEERFRLMVDSVRDYAIIMLDKEGRVSSWNRGAHAITGWHADEIIGQHFSLFYPADERQTGKWERELETATREGRFEEEAWRVRKDGSRFWANVVINAIKDDQDRLVGLTKVTRDLTERKLAAEALADEYQRRTEAERETRFAQMFIGILGHDLRNPLNAITMATRLIKRKLGAADPKIIERILSSTQRMSNMVDQLLDLTRSRLAGGIAVDQKPTDLSAIISGVVDELRLAHPNRQISWIDGEPQHFCACDPDRMAQVVSNLVGNALQHSDASTPVTVRLTRNRSEMALSVHNEGPPIPPELLPHLFEPYRRTSARSEGTRGLGLGLFITEQVVHAHGGRIEVRSTPEDGTTFTVTQPCMAVTGVAPATTVQ